MRTSESVVQAGICRCCLSVGDHRDFTLSYQAHKGDIHTTECYSDMFYDCYKFPLHLDNGTTLICLDCIEKLKAASELKKNVVDSTKHLSLTSDNTKNLVEISFDFDDCPTKGNIEKEEATPNTGDNEATHDVEAEVIELDTKEQSFSTVAEFIAGSYFNENAIIGFDNQKANASIETETKDLIQEQIIQDPTGPDLPTSNNKHIEKTDPILNDISEESNEVFLNEQNVSEDTADNVQERAESDKEVPSATNMNFGAKNQDLITQNNLLAHKTVLVSKECSFLPMQTKEEILSDKNTQAHRGLTAAQEMKDYKSMKSRRKDFYNEIRTVLRYTNATPYKTNFGRYCCAYCTTKRPKFFDANELRTHTRTVHAVDKIKNVDFIMRPTYHNEVLKLDIYRLQCTVCMSDIPEWNLMFEHLKDTHNVVLQHAYTKIIPFILDDDCACALCHKSFNYYHLLDVHMNAHYNKYTCGECGDTFLSEKRLKMHSEIHSTRRYPCKDCGKEFSLEKYRKKHHDFVHLQKQKFKCAHCDEIFKSRYSRFQHLGKVHNRTKIFECELCEMTFTDRFCYLRHKRRNHSMTNLLEQSV